MRGGHNLNNKPIRKFHRPFSGQHLKAVMKPLLLVERRCSADGCFDRMGRVVLQQIRHWKWTAHQLDRSWTEYRRKIKAKDFVFHRCVISLHPSLPPNEDSSTATERGAILCRYYRTLPTRC